MHGRVPTGPEAAEYPSLVPNHKIYMSWCWIKMSLRETVHHCYKIVTVL